MHQGRILLRSFRPAAFINVSGDDAFAFLQGQFSNELRQPPGAATYGLWLNQKGKVVADSFVLRQAENDFRVISLDSPAAVIRRRLEDFIVADDVILSDETPAMAGLAISGAGSAAFVNEVIGPVPTAGKFIVANDAWIFSGRRGAEEGCEIIGVETTLAAWREKFLARGATIASADEAEYARIAAGIPAVPVDIGPGDLPNEGGLDVAAISYSKGCYLGQEVMARLKNLGQVRRRLRVVRGRGPRPAPGAALFQGETKVGEIRSAADGPEGNFVALAMLSLVKLDASAGLSLVAKEPPALTLDAHG